MKIYAVGGCVRDRLMRQRGLNVATKDRDWVVVGSSPQAMLAAGFLPVGADFPVFLHPVTHEEYALARTERKTAAGYHGFQFYTAPDVTIEQDLRRRDLTINAIAEDDKGTIIDPYGGQQDICSHCLRHVSEAFSEDPVRVLRVARFAARFPNFTVAAETMQLMQSMVNNGETDALVAERVWAELSRGLMEKAPARMMAVLKECGYLEKSLSFINYNETIDKILQSDAIFSLPLHIRAVLLFSNVRDHGALDTIKKTLRLPAEVTDLLTLLMRQGALGLNVRSAEECAAFFSACDVLRRPRRFDDLLSAMQVLSPGFLPERLKTLSQAFTEVDAGRIAAQTPRPSDIARAIYQARLERLQALWPVSSEKASDQKTTDQNQ